MSSARRPYSIPVSVTTYRWPAANAGEVTIGARAFHVPSGSPASDRQVTRPSRPPKYSRSSAAATAPRIVSPAANVQRTEPVF